jgi:hypothetical protein
MKRLILSSVVALAAADTASAEGDLLAKMRTRLALKRDTQCGWDELFRNGTATGEPCGKTRGTVLSSDGPCPKLKARMQNLAWKGKTFHGDGTFINRWPGFEAISATTSQGTSLFDGQPCLVMQYDDKAPIFGGLRDELREIAPGTWLGRSYEGATGTFKGYFLLQSK